MTSKPFGPQSQAGLPTPLVATIGQGSWRLEQSSEVEAIAALRQGLDLGLTHIDTAEMYGSGAAERLIGRAIAGRREQVFLVSKVLPGNASLRGTIDACESSLQRLGTDYLDCYLLHWRGSVPLADTIAAFDRLQRDGKIRSWGVSNFDAADLDEVEALAGKGHPACNQVLYHLRERAIEHAVIPWCEQRGVAVVAYTPFGQSDAAYSRKSEGGRVLQTIAGAHGATPRQVALSFLLRHRTSFAIPKAVKPEHLIENAGAARVVLTGEDIATIEAAFPLGAEPRALPMI
jgi:diketogulonate reductase-like aldo/keto reductase